MDFHISPFYCFGIFSKDGFMITLPLFHFSILALRTARTVEKGRVRNGVLLLNKYRVSVS